MEVEYRHGWARGVHLLSPVGNVLRDQVLVGKVFLGFDDRIRDPLLPAAEQPKQGSLQTSKYKLSNSLSSRTILRVEVRPVASSERRVFEAFPMPRCEGNLADAVDVVRWSSSARRPSTAPRRRGGKRGSLHDDSVVPGCGHEPFQPPEVSLIPTGQVKPVAAVRSSSAFCPYAEGQT